MNKRLVGVLGFAAAVALAASFIVYKLLASRLASNSVPVATVVVAGRDLQPGSLLRAEDVKLAAWKGDLPKQAVISIDEAKDRGIVVYIHEGDMVMENSLAPKNV